MTRSRPDAILMVSDTLTVLNRKRVMEFAANNRLPAIYEFGFLVRDGGLMSYGPNLRETGERVGDLVARILAHGQRTYPSNSALTSSLLLISRLPRASASLSHRRFFHALMR